MQPIRSLLGSRAVNGTASQHGTPLSAGDVDPDKMGALPAYPGNISAYEHEMMLPPHVKHRQRRGLGRLARIILWTLIAVALAILLAMRLHTSDVEKATEQAEKFLVSMQSNVPDTAYGMGDAEFRKATTEQDLGAMFDKAEPFLQGAQIDPVDTYYASSKKGNPRAIVVYSATKSKKVTYVRLVMDRQDDGAWKVHSLLTQATPLQAKPE